MEPTIVDEYAGLVLGHMPEDIPDDEAVDRAYRLAGLMLRRKVRRLAEQWKADLQPHKWN